MLIDETRQVERVERPGVAYELLGDNIRGLREGFVGRRRILQRTRPVLRSGEKHILLLTGIGGAGKSTLATRLANRFKQDGFRIAAIRAREDEPGYQFCLRILTEIAIACQRLGRVIDENALLDGKRPMASRLRLAVEILNDAPIVLVLDNLETAMPPPPERPKWTDPDFAGFMDELCARLVGKGRAILTCRYVPETFDTESPNLLHEPLPDFTEGDFIKYLRRHEKVNARIESGELTLDLIEAFHRKLGGTPRFVEQACAVLTRIEPDDLAEQLERAKLPKPGTDPGELYELQQHYFGDLFLPRLYDALTMNEQVALSRFAFVEIPLPIDGVAAVTEVELSEAKTFVGRWIDLGMLQRFVESGEIPSYSVYSLQRTFLTHGCKLGDSTIQTTHHAAASFIRACFSEDSQIRIGPPFEGELSACLRHAEDAQDLDCQCWAAARLASGLLGRVEHFRVLAMIEPLLDLQRHPDLLKILIVIKYDMGDWGSARILCQELLDIHKRVSDRAGEAAVIYDLAMIEQHEGRYQEARALLEDATSLFQAVNDLGGAARTRHGIATLDVHEGNLPSARRNFSRALEIYRRLKDRAGEAATLHNLAAVDMNQGDYSQAIERSNKALTLKQATGDLGSEAVTWHQLATLDVLQGRHEDARKKFEKALALRRAIGSRVGQATTLHNLASIELREGKPKEARELFQEAIRMSQADGEISAEASTWHQLGSLDLQEDRIFDAVKKLQKALEMRRSIGDTAGEAASLHQLASIDLQKGDYAEAIHSFKKSLILCQGLGDRAGEAVALSQMAFIARQLGRIVASARLISLCIMIELSIGLTRAENQRRFLNEITKELRLGQADVDALAKEVRDNYQRDRGASLVAAAFEGLEESSTEEG